MKDELGGQIIKKVFGLRGKIYSCLKGNNDEDKKTKDTKKVCHKNENLNFKIIKTVQKQLRLKMK